VTIQKLWPLLLLGIIPFLWWARRRTVVDLSPKHLTLSTLVRTGVIACIALALAQPVIERSAAQVSTIYLVDVSQSISPAAIQNAIAWIQKSQEAAGSASSRFIAFASNSIVFDSLEDLKKVRVSAEKTPGTVDQSKTRLAAALDHAVRSFPPEHLKRLVVLSDGNANSGDLEAAMQHLRLEKVRVYAKPIASRATRDAWIENVIAPTDIRAEELVPVEVHVYSQFETPAEIEVRSGSELFGKRSVNLKEGMNRVAFEGTVKGQTASTVFEATARLAGDSLPANNYFRQSATVLGKPRVLYVEGYAASARYLNEALTAEGFQVDVAGAEMLPDTARALDVYDAVILSDIEKRLLSDKQMQAVAEYVRDFGGGFVLIGGENTYGKEGYTDSLIEEVLPVTFETEKERESLSLVIVLDRSGSMAGTKMELAKEATKAPLVDLREEDRFGVIVFDYNYKWEVPLQEVTGKNKADMRDTISRIVATGNTNIFPALREAYEQLKESEGETKHIILLSDGQTPADDFRGLATEMTKSKISVSTVAVTAASDRVLMENIATWGGGRAYYVDNPLNVPQIFADETQLAAGKSLREESFQPVVRKTVEAFKGLDFKTAPELHGFVSTKTKPAAEVLLAAVGEHPLLARWQHGLGRSAIFSSDSKDRWAAEWLTWRGYSKFWSQFVREIMRRRDNEEFDLEVHREGDEALVTVNAIERDGRFRNGLQPQLRVEGPGNSVTTVRIPQVGPGAYEVRVPLRSDGSYVFRTADPLAGSTMRSLEYSYPDEYHFYPPNTKLLRTISSETGGTYDPQPQDVFNTEGEVVAYRTPLWPWLASLALILFLADVLLRRLRLFESV
jgi:Mg-chelatase subunit ChlD